MRNIVVLGCGFAGYHAARRLEMEFTGRRRVQLTVVTRRAHFVFTPLLSHVASGELDPEHVITPVDEAFDARTRVVIDHIESVDLANRQLIGTHQPIPFDYLLVATGAVRDPTPFDGADNLVGPDTLNDAVAIHQQLRRHCAPDGESLRYAIIGGSSTGVAWAAELATALRLDPDLSGHGDDVDIDLYEARPRLLPDHSHQMSHLVTDYLKRLGVSCQPGQNIQSAAPAEVCLDDDQHTVTLAFHCAGRVGASLWSKTDISLDAKQRIEVDDDLSVPDLAGVYVAGDAAAPLAELPDRSNPQIALQQGRWAARNLLADMSGRAKKRFVYEDRGDFVTLGRNHAALELRGLVLEGQAAWLAYRLYYTALMPRPIQKARLLMDWIAGRIGADDSATVGNLETEKRDDKHKDAGDESPTS